MSSIVSKSVDHYLPLSTGFDAFLLYILLYNMNKQAVPLDRELRNLLSYLQ